jgi:DNA recombination protein RmuC
VPIEGALAVALQNDRDLTLFAAEKNIALATPTTLMLALKTIANIWDVERRNMNADLIAERAGRLYDKFVGFLNDLPIGWRLPANHPKGSIAIRKTGSNTSRKVLEKLVDAVENRSAQKTKTMLRTITVVLMTNPSRGSAFYFRRRDGEHYARVFNRYRDILTA